MGQNGEDRQINYSRARLTIGAKALGPPKNSALRNAKVTFLIGIAVQL